MNKKLKSTMKLKGVVTRRLYSREKFYDLLVGLGVTFTFSRQDIFNPLANITLQHMYREANQYLPKSTLNRLLEQSAKKQFKDNRLWRLFHKVTGLDLKIPVLFGYWTTKAIKLNTVTSVGKKIAADQIGGTTTTPVTAIAIGVGTPSTTALGSESTTNGAARGAATVTNTTTSTTGDTEQWVKTFSLSGSFAFTEEGLFDNNTSGGKMLASQSFSAVNVVSGDSFQITHQVKAA